MKSIINLNLKKEGKETTCMVGTKNATRFLKTATWYQLIQAKE